jgi:hypothetical protein
MAITELSTKLNETDHKTIQLSDKLGLACKEISAAQEAYAISEANAERLRKDLAKERADFQRLLHDTHKEIVQEQEVNSHIH